MSLIVIRDTITGPVLIDPSRVRLAMITPIKAKGDSIQHHLGLKFDDHGGGMFQLVFDTEGAAQTAMNEILANG